MSETGIHHGIDYVELATTDLEGTKTFYERAFGFRFNDYGPDYAGFVDGARGDREAGGLRRVDQRADFGADVPLIVLYSSDIEASEAAVRAAGGTIVASIFAFPGGRRFEFTDPGGNRLGVWSAT